MRGKKVINAKISDDVDQARGKCQDERDKDFRGILTKKKPKPIILEHAFEPY
jgi:hypothetical protein